MSRMLAFALVTMMFTAVAAAQGGAELAPPSAQAPAAQAPIAPGYAPHAAPPIAPGYPPYVLPQPAPYYSAPYYAAPSNVRGRPPIVGYRTIARPLTAMWVPGMITFLASWVGNFAAVTPLANAISSERDGEAENDSWAWSFVPIVGPWVQLGLGAPHPAIPLTLGVLQVGGLALMVAGLVTQESARIPIYAGDPEDPNAARLDVTAGLGTLGLVYTHH